MRKIILSLFLLISCTPINQNTNNTNSSNTEPTNTSKPITSINPSQTTKPSEIPSNELKKFVLSDTVQIQCKEKETVIYRPSICDRIPACVYLREKENNKPDFWEQSRFSEEETTPPIGLRKASISIIFYDELKVRYDRNTKTFYSKNGYDMSDYNKWLKDYNVDQIQDNTWMTEERAYQKEKEYEYELCKDYPNEYSQYWFIIKDGNIHDFVQEKLKKDSRIRQVSYVDMSIQPNGNNGYMPSHAYISGKVFDRLGIPVDEATVTITLLDQNIRFGNGSTSLSTKTTVQGDYILKDVPVGARIELKATKEGWTKQLRIETVRINLTSNPDISTFNFGTEGQINSMYSIHDEPQIESIKVNNVNNEILGKFGSDYTGRPTSSMTAAVTSLKPELIFEFMFTEPVNKESVQNAFRIDSEATLSGRVPKEFTLTGDSFDWTWSDDNKMVTLKSKKTLLQAAINNQMRYKVYFNEAFKDNNNLSAYSGAYFKFGTSTEKDYFTIALENDTTDAKLLKIENNDTGTSDQIILTFNKPFSVHDYTVPEVLLFSSYEIKKNATVFTTEPSKIELSPDGKSLVMEWTSNSTFVKNDIISLMVLTDKLKSPSGRVFSTSDTNKVEGIDTADNLKVVKVVN